MNQYLDLKTIFTAIVIGLLGWIGVGVTESSNTLIDFNYRFEAIAKNLISLKDTIESNNQSLRNDIDMLKKDRDDFDRRLTRLEVKSEK